MKKAILLLMAAVMMAGCAEQQDFDITSVNAAAPETKVESFDDYMAKAKWGDGDAYLKLADCYIKGNGVKKDLMGTMTMLSMAVEYGGIPRIGEYMENLPEDNDIRMAYEAMEYAESDNKEKGLELADQLIAKGCADGYAVKGYITMEMGDTIEGMRLASLAAEQESVLGKVIFDVLPFVNMAHMPDEEKMSPLAAIMPIFYEAMAEEYAGNTDKDPQNESKAAKYYVKAFENCCLSKMGALWLVNYKERGGELTLTETDWQCLKQLAKDAVRTVDEDTYEEDMDLWEEEYADSIAVDSVYWDEMSPTEDSEAIKAAASEWEETNEQQK